MTPSVLLSPSSSPSLTIVIAGGGNATHVLCGLLGQNPDYTIRLWDVMPAEVDTWQKNLAANENKVRLNNLAEGERMVFDGTVSAISTDAKDVLPGADLLLIAVPAFAHEVYLKGAVPFASPKLAVGCMVAEGGFDWQLRDIFGDMFPHMVTFAMETLPWCEGTALVPFASYVSPLMHSLLYVNRACRLAEYGRSADIKGTKDVVHVAITPESATDDVLSFLNSAISVK